MLTGPRAKKTPPKKTPISTRISSPTRSTLLITPPGHHFNRMKQWDGGIFNAYNAIEFEAAANNVDLVDLATDLTAIQANAANVPHFSTQLQSDIAAATTIADLQGILGADVTDAELARRGQDRTDYNMRVGQSSVKGGRFFANFSYPLDDEGTELYAFTGK